MRPTRREFLLAGAFGAAGAAGLAGCVPDGGGGGPLPTCAPPAIGGFGPLPPVGSAGLIDEGVFGARVSEYLSLATQTLQPTNSASVIAHLIRAAREPGFSWTPAAVTPALVDPDPFRDTDDFELMSLQWVVRLGDGVLPADTMEAIRASIAGARYRYDDPLPAGALDNKWFWSENHRIMFAVDEYLGGLAVPDRVFTFTGLTGAQHAARSRQRIVDWIRERATYGFSEWHSNIYMKYDYAPLLTLVEFAPDEELVSLAAAAADVALFDLATHTMKGAYGVTHGRTYKGAKTNSLVETTFGTAKLLFDTTDQPYQSTTDIGPTFLCGSTRYRLPAVIRNVARTSEVATIRERHGVALDPHEEFSLAPPTLANRPYSDPANLPFWWSQGALTAWQMLPVTLDAAKRWNLLDTELFQRFAVVKQFADINAGILQVVIRELASFAAQGVLGEAHTYTWRSPDAMLSSAVDHRFGDAMEQSHAWQATLDPRAVVFTTHPQKAPAASLDWGSDNGYWTGTASMPRSAQSGRAAIHIYRPSYVSPTDAVLGPYFGYQPYTHAFFPQDRFDEVVEAAGWVFARTGDGYVALWSERPTQWRPLSPATEATDGHTLPFDLVAHGGADNAWVVEVGRRADHGSFADFVAAVSAAPVTVTRTGPEVAVSYASPMEGLLEFGTVGAFRVAGAARALRDHPRHSSPWAEQCHLGEGFDIADGGSRLRIDFTTGGRVVD
ncbi:MAG: hypothetical protein U0Q22_12765 [Acidimicrobiales bacterium]